MRRNLLWLFVVVLVAPLGVTAASFETTIDGGVLFEDGAMVPLGQLEIHIAPGTVNVDTAVSVDELGVPSTRSERSLSPRYRTADPVYLFSVEPSANAFMVVRLTPLHETNRRQRLWYRSEPSTEWEQLDTTFTSSGQLQATVPFGNGEVVVGTHRYAVAAPVRDSEYIAYSGTPYSASAAVIDSFSGKFLYRENARSPRSIASLTKLLTTLVFLEADPDLDSVVHYHRGNDRGGATVPLEQGDQLTLRDVLMATLIPSANNMAMTLANSIGLTEQQFLDRAHERLDDLGLRATHLDEPTGLDADNVSTAGNVARLARFAFAQHPEVFASAAAAESYDVSLKNRSETIHLYSTNKFDGRGRYVVTAFKTGYLPGSAERTLVLQVEQMSTGYSIIVVLLGNPEYNTIFDEAYALVDWTFSNWEFVYPPQ